MHFNKIVFWCEFPQEVNWNKFNKIFNINSDIYLAVETKKEFLNYKKKIKNKNVKNLGVWPILPIKEGYWFSSYTSKESINKLDQFKGIKAKIDLEPPLLTSYSWIKFIIAYSTFFILKRPKNKEYLNQKIIEFSKTAEIILSGFPYPKRFSKIYGDTHLTGKNIQRNFFIYRTLIPKFLRPVFRIYFKSFIKKSIKKHSAENVLFAVGCIGHGILRNEPTYETINHFDEDLKFLLKHGIKNAVIFDLSAIMNKKDPKEWLNVIKKHTNQ